MNHGPLILLMSLKYQKILQDIDFVLKISDKNTFWRYVNPLNNKATITVREAFKCLLLKSKHKHESVCHVIFLNFTTIRFKTYPKNTKFKVIQINLSLRLLLLNSSKLRCLIHIQNQCII